MSTRASSLDLLDAMRAHATHRPQHLAIVDDQAGYSTSELWDASRAFAGRLRDSGVGPGATVAIGMGGSAPHFGAIFGCLLAGATVAPLNTTLTRSELERYVDVIEPALVLVDPGSPEAPASLTGVLVIDDDPTSTSLPPRLGVRHERAERVDLGLDVAEDTPAFLFPTGGTTGLPKAAIHTRRGVALWVMAVNGVTTSSGAVDLCASPLFHTALLSGPLATMYAGGATVVLRRFEAERAVDCVLHAGANRVIGAPTLIKKMQAVPEFEQARLLVKYITLGSMASSPEFVDEMLVAFPNAALTSAYGATEFGAVTRILHDDYVAGRRAGVGRPVPGASITVRRDDGERAAPDEPGALVVRCPWQAVGYRGRPEEDAATFTAEGVRIGDVGSMDDDGWLTIYGRSSEIVVTGGENVFPAEVESVLAQHPDVAEVVILGMPDPDWGTRVEAVVVTHGGASLTTDDLRDFARPHLAGYKLPRSVRVVDHVPLTGTNKPDRRALQRVDTVTDPNV